MDNFPPDVQKVGLKYFQSDRNYLKNPKNPLQTASATNPVFAAPALKVGCKEKIDSKFRIKLTWVQNKI